MINKQKYSLMIAKTNISVLKWSNLTTLDIGHPMRFPKPYVISGTYPISHTICFPIFGYMLPDF